MIATTGNGDAEAKGYTRQFISFVVPLPTIIVGGLTALVSAKAWYDHHRQGEMDILSILALVLSGVGIAFSLLI